jgi:S-DNA-T family DNA segregation ATPase FtsK/SpoIIIE
LFIGIPGSGTSTALATVALTMAAAWSPDQFDLLVLDLGAGDLAPLARLPHCLGYAAPGAAAREQQIRLLKYLHAELDRRKARPAGQRRLVVLIDGLATLKDEYQDSGDQSLLDGLYRAWSDGPDVGLWCAAATARSRAIPSAIDDVTTQKWLFRLADPYDYSTLGVKPAQIPPAVPGRCVLAQTKLQTHVATPDQPLAEAVATARARWAEADHKTSVTRPLPEQVAAAELPPADLAGEPWRVPVGLRESDLEPAWLELYDNEHVLIAGPARSGKSTVLLALADNLRRSDATVWGLCQRRSPLAVSPLLDRVAITTEDINALLTDVPYQKGNLVLLIDDAEQFEDGDHVITNLITADRPNLHLIAAGRSDDLRGSSLYNHWTKHIRKARCGLLLQPEPDYDGALLGVTITRKLPAALTVGRGYACQNGVAVFVQTASADAG